LRLPTTEDSEAHSPRDQALQEVHDWFLPAMRPDEKLRAVLAVTPYPLAMFSSLFGTATDIIGWGQDRAILVTDRAIHAAGRHFWRWRTGVLLASFPLGTVPIRYAGGQLGIGEETFYVYWSGF